MQSFLDPFALAQRLAKRLLSSIQLPSDQASSLLALQVQSTRHGSLPDEVDHGVRENCKRVSERVCERDEGDRGVGREVREDGAGDDERVERGKVRREMQIELLTRLEVVSMRYDEGGDARSTSRGAEDPP